MDKARALSLGLVAALVIICGVLIGVLMWQITQEVVDGLTDSDSTYGGKDYSSLKKVKGPVWLGGIIYVLPGLLCLIAALVQNKCVYILSCILSLLCSAIVGLVLVILGMPIVTVIVALVVVKDSCIDDKSGHCRCKGDDGIKYTDTPFESCEFLSSITNLSIGLFVVLCLGLIFLLTAFVMACIYACRSKSTAGTVYTPAQQPMLQG